jgi:transcriptional regulator with XRE-family HTH domain
VILNERQYKASKASVRRFQEQIGELEKGLHADDHERRDTMRAAYQSQIADIESEIAEYEALQHGVTRVDTVTSLEQLRLALIRARIAKGWTQEQLANALGVSPQQVQKDEMNRYATVGVDRLQTVADALGLTFSGEASLPVSTDAAECEPQPQWRKPLLLLLLHYVKRRHHRRVAGYVEMQKLSLLVETTLRRSLCWTVFKFEPYRYGAFDPDLDDDLTFLEHHEFIRRRPRGRGQDLTAIEPDRVVDIEVCPKGGTWLGQFETNTKLASVDVKRQVFELVSGVVAEHGSAGRQELLRYTYEQFPDLTTRSTIKGQVERSRKHATRRRTN